MEHCTVSGACEAPSLEIMDRIENLARKTGVEIVAFALDRRRGKFTYSVRVGGTANRLTKFGALHYLGLF